MTAVDPALRATRTTCPYCGVGCGVIIEHNGSAFGVIASQGSRRVEHGDLGTEAAKHLSQF